MKTQRERLRDKKLRAACIVVEHFARRIGKDVMVAFYEDARTVEIARAPDTAVPGDIEWSMIEPSLYSALKEAKRLIGDR